MDPIPFIPNQLYKRTDIHALYGGNGQSGISPSAKFPYIFIFSGKTGNQYGYKDRWDNENIFSYTGEGQIGDMKFVKGNLALRDHINNGKRVFLFEYQKSGIVKFITELEFFDFGYFPTTDLNKNERDGIKFFFKRKGVQIPITPAQLNDVDQLLNEEEFEMYHFRKPNKTERTGLVTSRVGQGAYRKSIIIRWEYKCAVSGFNNLKILIASHIVPWSDANDNERLDVHNGILLSPTYDALFDKHLISFDNNGKILLSDQIDIDAYHKIGVTGTEKIQKLSHYNLEYLIRHREVVYK